MRRRWAWGCSQHATTMMTRSYPTCSMSNPTNYWFLAPGELKRVIIPLRHRAATSNGDRTGVRGEGPSKSNHHSENPQAKDLPALTTWHPWKMLSTHGRPAGRPSVRLSVTAVISDFRGQLDGPGHGARWGTTFLVSCSDCSEAETSISRISYGAQIIRSNCEYTKLKFKN